jgi:hypothetical protein
VKKKMKKKIIIIIKKKKKKKTQMEREMREEADGAWEPQSKFFWETKNGTV